MSEFLDIVDTNDQVIGKASREDIYANRHTHRIVHAFIFNSAGRMALQLRSRNSPFCPLHWSTTVGGHVQSSETYEEAALRECEEEIGAVIPLTFLAKDFYTAPNRPDKFLTTFKAVYDGPLEPNPEEVEEIRYFEMGTIRDMVKNGEKFHPELLFLLKKHYS